jgi:hypothetical protein
MFMLTKSSKMSPLLYAPLHQIRYMNLQMKIAPKAPPRGLPGVDGIE